MIKFIWVFIEGTSYLPVLLSRNQVIVGLNLFAHLEEENLIQLHSMYNCKKINGGKSLQLK